MVLRDICKLQRDGMVYETINKEEINIPQFIQDKKQKLLVQGKDIAEIGELYETESDIMSFALNQKGVPVIFTAMPKHLYGNPDAAYHMINHIYYSTILNGYEYLIGREPYPNMYKCYQYATEFGVLIGDNFGLYFDKMSPEVRQKIETILKSGYHSIYCCNGMYNEEEQRLFDEKFQSFSAKQDWSGIYRCFQEKPQMRSSFYNDYIVVQYLVSGIDSGNPFACFEAGYSGQYPFTFPNIRHIYMTENEWRQSPQFMDKPPLKVVDLNSIVADMMKDERFRPYLLEHKISNEEHNAEIELK